MIRRFLLFSLLSILSMVAFAQKQPVSGVIKDSLSGETIIGANIVILGTTTGTTTDINGHFTLMLNKGKYGLQVSYIGYTGVVKNIVVSDAPVTLDFNIKAAIEIEGVEIIADYAKVRETPVAFTTILPARIEERLSGQDIPLLLNKTPGVYATQQGGGDGDARITIRGFNQRFVAVMLDGIPVNDMENGWVYWSNWFGLDAVTRDIQVQRGLGRSKLALPSVGGTMNIVTKGIENKRQLSVEQSVDDQGKLTTNVGYTSGRLKKGWALTAAGAYKAGNGWVEQTNVKAFFLYIKVDKMWGKHLTSLTGFGAPQTHVDRSYKRGIADYDSTIAKKLGITSSEIPASFSNQGIAYNSQWGYIKRDADTWNSDQTARIIDPNAPKVALNGSVNTYFKPQYSLRDSWNVSDKLLITNILYLSTGSGGGTRPRTSLKNTQLISEADYANNPGVYSQDEIGQINWQSIYNANSKGTNTGFGIRYPINTLYSDKLYYSNNYIAQATNNHKWFGLLSTFALKLNKEFSLSGGVDLRSYTSEHYYQVTDLLGGDYAIDLNDKRNDYATNSTLAMKRVGDKVYYYDSGMIKWGGLFGLLEYKTGKINTFVNLTTSLSGFKDKDYFGQLESAWKYVPGFTVKTGLNYNIDKHSNVFFNAGFLSKAKDFASYFVPNKAIFLPDSVTKNERVKALELGYSYNSKVFTANVNAYYTKWENKPTNAVSSKLDDLSTFGNIPGMDALHKGVELDFIYKIMKTLDFQGLVSLGNWVWDKKISNLQMYYTDTREPANKISFDATGIHVGDAAQTQLGASIRYEPFKGMYVEGGGTFFDRYYANFSPEACTDANGNPVESWMMPSYTLFDLHAGYRFKLEALDKLNFTIKFNVLNVLNTMYISDATNNDAYLQVVYNTFDARSASVFMGAGRQITASLKIVFN
ncbi:MAG: TonB-dependent receptor [Bacteroidota bacterium]